MTDGILNVYKERGYTSHDVVAKLRGILRQRKIGHTGTLDPDAEGVLPVCLGKATKVCELLLDRQKTYRATLLLGTVTDTQDLTGTVQRTAPVSCSSQEILECAASFQGRQLQIPPMYSAVHINGQRLYELARRGLEVERQAREIEIASIVVEEIALPRITMTVTCSKGTYIRTLCHDIGERLGCGGCMEKLLRTAVGSFCLEDSLTLEQIAEINGRGELETILQRTDAVFSSFPAVTLDPGTERLVRNGNPFSLQTGGEEPKDGTRIRVYAPDGSFLAVYAWSCQKNQYRAVKMFL